MFVYNIHMWDVHLSTPFDISVHQFIQDVLSLSYSGLYSVLATNPC